MTEAHTTAVQSGGPRREVLPAVLLLFFAGGCAALIYEIVWFQLLELVIGSTAVSLGIVLGVFMGGLCLGSVLSPRYIPARWHPLRVYAVIEGGIGVLGAGVILVLPVVSRFYAAHVGSGMPGFLWRGALCVVCLLPS